MAFETAEQEFIELSFHETLEGDIPSYRFNRRWVEAIIAPTPLDVFLSEYTYYDTEYLLELQEREKEAMN